MAIARRYFLHGIELRPTTDESGAVEGTLLVNSSTNKLKAYLASAFREVITADQTQTLTNKTFDADANTLSNVRVANLASGVLDTDITTTSASDDTIPSAKAVKTYVDTRIASKDEASEIAYSNSTSGLVAVNVQTAIDEVEGRLDTAQTNITTNATNISNHISNSTGAHAASAIANTPAGNIAATDVQSALNELDSEKAKLNGDTAQQFAVKRIEVTTITDSTTTGSNASLAASTSGVVRLTNGSLVSLANIPAGNAGQHLELVNRTGATVTVIDSASAVGTAGLRIITGTGANLALANDATVLLEYDATSSRWQVIGGSGGSNSATDTTFNINDAVDPTKQINFDAGGTTSTKTTIAASQTTNRTVTLPDATDTLVGKATTDTLTNKTIVAANNTITTAASGNLSSTSLNAALAELQSDIDSRVKQPNYISANPDAEVDTTGYATYADAAATSPVDGTGGSPTVTLTRTTSSPLRGTASFLITKDAANRQGNGVSYDFTIDPADKGKVLQGTLDYQIASGTYADNDVSIWIYDVTNGTLIQPAPYLLKNTTIIDKMFFEFQTSSSSTSYRLIFHVASTSASAYTIKFDNLNVGPQGKLYGSAETDWVAYTPTFTGWGTVTSIDAYWKRVGDSIFIKAKYTSGTLTATEARISLPSGLTTTAFASIRMAGIVGFNTNQNDNGVYVLSEPSVSYLTFGYVISGSQVPLTKKNGNDFVTGTFSIDSGPIPIAGWSSSQVMSNDADTRVVAAIISGTAASVSAGNPIIYPTINSDTHGAYNTTTGLYTAPVGGYYRVTTYNNSVAAIGTAIYVSVNGNTTSGPTRPILAVERATNGGMNGSGVVYVLAGQTISIRPDASLSGFGSDTYACIERISGPAQIAASESVSALYTGAPPTGTLAAGFNTTTFGTKVKDTHGVYSSGTYTVPSSGTYSVSAMIGVAGTLAINNYAALSININGSSAYESYRRAGGAESTLEASINVHSIPLKAGDTVIIKSACNGTGMSFSSGADNAFSIVRTGNY